MPSGLALDQGPALDEMLDENLLPWMPRSAFLNKKVLEGRTRQAHTNFLNTVVPGSSPSGAPGNQEPGILPTNTLGALGFAPKLYLAQVRPAHFKDLTQMSLESPKLG